MFAILSAFLVLSAHAKTVVVDIAAGHTLGGYGDVATNLLMAKRLRQLRPDLTVRLLVDPASTGNLLHTLEPRFHPDNQTGTFDGIEYYNMAAAGGRPAVPADFTLGFSLDGTPPLTSDQNSRRTLFFYEMGIFPNDPMELSDPVWSNSVEVRRREKNASSSQKDFWAIAGTGPKEFGLYVLPKEIPPPLSREELVRKLDELSHQVYGKNFTVNRKTMIGVSYARSESESARYLKTISQMANENPDRNVLIVAQGPIPKDTVLPKNVCIRNYPSLPFDASEAAIAISTVPILVTGDISLTLAIQHAKPFMYEVQDWKRKSIKDIAERLLELNPELIRWTPTINHLLKGDSITNPAEITSALSDKSFVKGFELALSKLRNEQSLPQFVSSVIDRWDELKLNDKSSKAASRELEQLRTRPEPSHLIPFECPYDALLEK